MTRSIVWAVLAFIACAVLGLPIPWALFITVIAAIAGG